MTLRWQAIFTVWDNGCLLTEFWQFYLIISTTFIANANTAKSEVSSVSYHGTLYVFCPYSLQINRNAAVTMEAVTFDCELLGTRVFCFILFCWVPWTEMQLINECWVVLMIGTQKKCSGLITSPESDAGTGFSLYLPVILLGPHASARTLVIRRFSGNSTCQSFCDN